MEACRQDALKLRKLYWYDCQFPEWVVHPEIWASHHFSETIVFYHKEDSLDSVKQLCLEREPCNIGMRRLYDGDTLYKEFGWKVGAYSLSTPDSPMPNISVYCHATIHTEEKGFFNVHVLNLIGCARDSPRQPDVQIVKTTEHLIQWYTSMWGLALEAVKHLKKTKFQLYNVGGGAFAGNLADTFITDIFEPAFLPLLPDFELAGITVLGYDTQTKRFTGGFIPNCLNEPSQDLENTVFVNAWDPWSLIGNGNEMDNSLDGWWGRSSNMSILGWLKTNPAMKFIAV